MPLLTLVAKGVLGTYVSNFLLYVIFRTGLNKRFKDQSLTLLQMVIDTLKVDRSFIRNLPQDFEDKAIIESIIAMGKTLSLNVVAEGVETLAQDKFLREKFCDEMQGFYFSKPVAPDQFADLLRKHNKI